MTDHTPFFRRRSFILAVISLVNLCAGSLYAWSVLSAAAADHLTLLSGRTVTAGELAAAFSLANSIGPVPMILGGLFNDRFGPRLLIMTGGLMMGAGLVLSGFAQSAETIIFGYGLLYGLGLGFAYGAGISTVMKYFPDRRGFAGGVVTAAYGMSSVILPPIAQSMISSVGISDTFIILGITFAAVITAGGWFCRRPPENALPAGTTLSKEDHAGMNWRQMIANPLFPYMLSLLMCGAVSGMMILSQAAAIGRIQAGLSAGAAAAAVSTIALFNMAGRLVAGTLSDRFGRLAVLSGGLILSALGLLMLSLASPEAPLWFYAGCILVGIAFGTFLSVYPGFTADRFGTAHASVNYGIMFTGFALAGMAGPALMHGMRGAGFSFAACFGVAALFCFAGLFLARRCAHIIKARREG